MNWKSELLLKLATIKMDISNTTTSTTFLTLEVHDGNAVPV